VISRHASTNGSKSNGEGEVGAGLEVVAALREELLPGEALLVAHSAESVAASPSYTVHSRPNGSTSEIRSMPRLSLRGRIS
jgi:hypothetical protein